MVYNPKHLDTSGDVSSPKPTRLRQPNAVKRSVHAQSSSLTTTNTTKRTTSRMNVTNNNTIQRRPVEKKNTRQQPASNKSIPTTLAKANGPNRRQPHSPHARSPPAPTKKGGHKPPTSRSPATTRKSLSPVAQMREQYDKLKLQNNQNINVIAMQQDELRKLKDQLAQQQQPATPPPEVKQPNHHAMKTETTESQLHELEQKIMKRDQELEQLRLELKQQDAFDKDDRLLALEKREKDLQQREDMLKQSRNDDRLNQLYMENKQVLQRLAEKEKELQTLQDKLVPEITALNQQLEQQKQMHQQSLRQHEIILCEKQQLLQENETTLKEMQNAHQDEISKLQADQIKKILLLKQQHAKEMADVKARLEEAESKLNHGNTAEKMEEQLEQVLKEFEQAEHSHPVVQHDKQQQIQQGGKTPQQHSLKQQQQPYTSRFLPTEAVSWPAPQPLSILRKTNNAYSQEIQQDDDDDDQLPDLIPSTKIQLYISSVSGSPLVKRHQDTIQQLLKNNNISFQVVDVAASKMAVQHLKRHSNSKSNDGYHVPQVFVGGEYRGRYEEILQHAENGTLEEFLRPESKAQDIMESTQTSTTNSSSSWHHHHHDDDDEYLLKELEKELCNGKQIDLDTL